ncbi:putative pyridoxal kinase BUD17 NDAI_0K01570 [Naumovozyma dairenensis CBS 421]|uniref:pyridoxal kinase n=1 Tax=Naumovozyma dairenensis (strain ATCC 10597 / BCRC 20456 / CBS 421 / NBRC 0211 / NRRL Y-12639) TaxID=1071378 RepID=G0WHT7_NAUDC|nr:hypothetical protein NDAI_0K01570 [Naumovozyma dairenensis CBS 421]CCD27348.1 hypothetical protein NDAI_0K01570 [Naumovozyma dairenensis CBS 421]
MTGPSKKLLSIQSHVIHGYVGNKAATFPLQYNGWDVDALNTVQFSNHPGYDSFNGYKYGSQELYDIVSRGLLNGLKIRYDVLLTGYLPCVASLNNLNEIANQMKQMNPDLKWIMDPVLGDNGRLYVPEENIPAYTEILRRNQLYLVTPNHFEMETLTGCKINSLSSLKVSFHRFHELYPKAERIVVTSIDLSVGENEVGDQNPFYLVACCDTTTTRGTGSDEIEIYFYQVPKIHAQFSGSGDLFTALLLNALLNMSSIITLSAATSQVIWTVNQILERTYKLSLAEEEQEHNDKRINNNINKKKIIKDLKLIQCKDLFNKFPNREIETLAAKLLD